MDLNESIVKSFWRLFDRGNFVEAGDLMLPGAVIKWPNTREVFKGRDRFIDANVKYPDRWRINVERILSLNETVVSVVRVENEERSMSFYATSFFKFDGGLIGEITEYWGENGEPPQWRLDQKLSERY